MKHKHEYKEVNNTLSICISCLKARTVKKIQTVTSFDQLLGMFQMKEVSRGSVPISQAIKEAEAKGN
jgi:hypothetical protein